MTRSASADGVMVHSAGTPLASTCSVRTSAGSVYLAPSNFETRAPFDKSSGSRRRFQSSPDGLDLWIFHRSSFWPRRRFPCDPIACNLTIAMQPAP